MAKKSTERPALPSLAQRIQARSQASDQPEVKTYETNNGDIVITPTEVEGGFGVVEPTGVQVTENSADQPNLSEVKGATTSVKPSAKSAEKNK